MGHAYQIKIPDGVLDTLRKTHPLIKRRIKLALKDITADPYLGKMLKKEMAGIRSYRIGKFQIIYRTSRKYIEVIAIGPRTTIYRETLQLLKKKTVSLPPIKSGAGSPQG